MVAGVSELVSVPVGMVSLLVSVGVGSVTVGVAGLLFIHMATPAMIKTATAGVMNLRAGFWF